MPILSNFPGGAGSGSGGLTLAAVSNITTQVASGKVYIKWTDPDDLVVADSAIASWGGTLLVRKAGSAPTSRRDGTIIVDSKTRNAYQNTYFCDSGLSNDTKYFYKFFPYTTTNAYTDSTDNEFDATPTVQVTGIENWRVTGMTASEEAGNGKMTVKWNDPAAAITSDGVTLATWASTTVVVKAGGYAVSRDDAGAAYTLKVTTRNQYSGTPLTITGLTNATKYYLSFFPETTDGGINDSNAQRTTGTANRMTIATVPSQSGSLTYTGNEQTPAWSNYNTNYMTVGGTTKGTNAGSYTASFTPKDDYRWSDGTTAAKEVVWSIGKANGSFSLSASSVTLNTGNLTETVTVTRAGDGAVTAESNNTEVATVSVSGTTLTISHVNRTTGNATVTVKVAAGTNHTAPADQTISVAAQFISTTLNDNSWETISEVAAAGTGANYWEIGDCKAVAVNGTVGAQTINGTYYVYIIGFAHNDAAGTIDFGTFKTAASGGKDICISGLKMAQSSSRAMGWKSCTARLSVLGSTDTDSGDASTSTATNPVSGTLMAALPDDLRAFMKPMTIYTDNTGTSGASVTTSIDYLPLLAEFEIFGTRTNANYQEQNYQKQYAYYSAGNSKVKYKHSAINNTDAWFERSPYTGYTAGVGNVYGFCAVNANGIASYFGASLPYGIAPIFRV